MKFEDIKPNDIIALSNGSVFHFIHKEDELNWRSQAYWFNEIDKGYYYTKGNITILNKETWNHVVDRTGVLNFNKLIDQRKKKLLKCIWEDQ